MTVIAGFWCMDGVVMIGDRQLTRTGVGTHPESKLAGIKWGNGRGVLSYSGWEPTWNHFYKEICGRLEADPFPHCGHDELERAFIVTVQPCKSRVTEIFKNLQFRPGS
jgi:hypothetical protein